MNFNKMTWLVVAVVSMLHLVSATAMGEARAEKKIGVLLFSDEARYVEATKGALEQLRKRGFKEPAVRFTIENAGGSKVKAAEVAQKFASAKMDLIIAVGTTAAIAVTSEIKDVPVVFSVVYDPVDTKIAQDWKSSGNNTTGASSKVPMEKLVHILQALAPVKRLAVLYTPTEKNSVAQLKELQEVEAEAKIKVIPVPLLKEEDIAQLLPEVTRSADALFLSGSSIIGANVPTIVDMASKAKVVTITHLEDMVEQGALLGVCADSYAMGRLTGEKAAKVLRGAKPSSIPIEPLKKLDVIVNMRTAKAGKFQLPAAFMKKVTKVIK